MTVACRLSSTAIAGLIFASVGWGQQQPGYSIDGGRVVIGTREQWTQWQAVSKTVEVTDEGVRPVFVRKHSTIELDGERVVVPGINAVLDASQFGGGIRNAGSGPASAANLMDGEMDSFWEPDTSTPIQDWWVQVDLGRAVSATKIVLRFVDEELGDPFLQFRVLTSQGEQTIGPLVFRSVYATDRPIKDQRIFEIDLTRQSPSKFPEVRGDFTGDVIRYVGVAITDSDYGKARRVSEEEYGNLEPDRRGDVEYYRQEASGRLRLLESREDWEGLDGEKRGPVVHYGRELPRLAEVEVWSIGDNIGVGVLQRGGSVRSAENNGTEAVVVDGDIHSTERAPFWPAQGGYNPDKLLPSEPLDVERQLIIDLAGSFFLDNIRVIQATSTPPGAFRAYRVQLSDGSTNAAGGLAWKTVGSLDDIPGNVIYHDFKFPLSRVEYFSFTYRLFVGAGRHGLSEVQFFGEGYMPRVKIASVFSGSPAFIDLGRDAQNLASIEWDADLPPGTDIVLQTKTGDTVRNITHYYKKNGQEFGGTEAEAMKAYEANRKAFGESSVGPIVTEAVPGSDWSGWSQRYFLSGDRISSPSPRRFSAIQATFLTDDPLACATLRSVALNFVTPVAKAVVAEVLPPKLEDIGATQNLSYFVRSTFESGNRGFDEILLEAPEGVEMQLRQVKVDITGRAEQILTASSEGFEVIPTLGDSLWIHLPTPIKTTSGSALIEIQFETAIYGSITSFDGSVRHSSFEDSWQRADAGDANGITDSEKTVILALEGKEVLGGIDIAPQTFTPNGDGINDQATVTFSLMRVGTSVGKAVPLDVRVYDIGGRLVSLLRDETILAGRHSVVWTGTDRSGAMVPPGIYIVRVGIDLDSPSGRLTVFERIVHVVY